MGREIRRVPVDFDWPLNKVWAGYLMPDDLDLPQCQTCDGDGSSYEARAIADTFYAHQISWTDRARGEALAWCDKIGQAEVDNLVAKGRLRTWNTAERRWEAKPLTAAEVNERQRRGGLDGHDAINRWILVKFRCERLGIPLHCPTCEGRGEVGSDEQRAVGDAWERTDPPAGEGWQLWETVSEGSPISPVFPDGDGLVHWLSTDYRWGAVHQPMTREQAEALVRSGGWAPSFVGTAAGLQDGMTAVADAELAKGREA